MRTYEVFLKKDGKEGFRHAGALDAPDDEMALLLARECYSRRGEGDELWLVDRRHLLVAGSEFMGANNDKAYRFSDGSLIAERRRRRRDEDANGDAETDVADGERR